MIAEIKNPSWFRIVEDPILDFRILMPLNALLTTFLNFECRQRQSHGKKCLTYGFGCLSEIA